MASDLLSRTILVHAAHPASYDLLRSAIHRQQSICHGSHHRAALLIFFIVIKSMLLSGRNPEPSFISPTWNEHQRLFKVYVDCCCCCSCCNEIAQPLIFSGDPSGRDFGFWFALSWQRCPIRKRNGVLIHLVERITVLIYIEISDKFHPAGESFTGSSPLDFRCKQFQC